MSCLCFFPPCLGSLHFGARDQDWASAEQGDVQSEKNCSPWFRNMLQQETGEVMESEDMSVEFETPTDDEEITIPSPDKYRKVPDIPDFDIRDEQTLSNTQRKDWLLPTEPMYGARPRHSDRERPTVIDNPALKNAAGNTAVRNPSRTFLLLPRRWILMEDEVFTPPGGGGSSPCASGCTTWGTSCTKTFSGGFSGGQVTRWRSVQRLYMGKMGQLASSYDVSWNNVVVTPPRGKRGRLRRVRSVAGFITGIFVRMAFS